MDPKLQEILLELIVNIVSIILGGGIIMMIIEWRRHQREQRKWEREDRLIEIDIPRADMSYSTWQFREEMSDGEKLNIYENNLEDTIRSMLVIVEFVIRNTTGSEIIITKYDVILIQIPPGDETKRFYDLETADLISVQDIGPVKLSPYAVIARTAIVVNTFSKNRRLETPPSALAVIVTTSSGNVLQGTASLRIVRGVPDDIKVYQEELHLKKYIQKIQTHSDNFNDIPF
ncbi:MAG: hypothetical protein AB1894_17110 [Chloroflexota bacterium]